MTTITNEQRENALAIIRDMRAHGHALSFIANALQRAGVPTLSGKTGARWDSGTVSRLLKLAQ